MITKELLQNPLFEDTVQTLLSIIDEAIIYPRGHYKRMAVLCAELAAKIGLPPPEVAGVNLAALLHDIAVVYIPADIIRKTTELTNDEMLVVRQHPVMSEKILSNLKPLQGVLPLVRHHHELYDGSGYPDGLAGEQIPYGSRIINIVESFVAMGSLRPYRSPKSMPLILEELEKNKGLRFDSDLVDEFIRLLNKKLNGPSQTNGAGQTKISKETPEPENDFKPEEIARDIFEQVKVGKIDLPVLPAIIQEIQTAIDRPNTTNDDLARIIEKDAIVAIRVMSTANSPMYMGQQRVRSIREAIPRIGFRETRNIVSVITSKNLFQTQSKEYMRWMEELWLHSLASAYGARILADYLKYPEPEKYFLMGLVHDIGKVLILKTLSENEDWSKGLTRSQVEKVLQIGHNSLGAIILRFWKFPKEFYEIATSHEGPKFFDTTSKSILMVHLASQMASSIGYGYQTENLDLAELDSAKRLKVEAEAILAFCDRIKTLVTDSTKSF